MIQSYYKKICASSRCWPCLSASASPTKRSPGAGTSTTTSSISDRPELLVDLNLPQDASIYATEKQVERFEALLKGDPNIDRYSLYVGQGAIRFYLPLNVHSYYSFLNSTLSIEGVVNLARRLDEMGYRGDYSFEVFNDDYTQLPPPVVAERARRSVKWLASQMSRRTLPVRRGLSRG